MKVLESIPLTARHNEEISLYPYALYIPTFIALKNIPCSIWSFDSVISYECVFCYLKNLPTMRAYAPKVIPGHKWMSTLTMPTGIPNFQTSFHEGTSLHIPVNFPCLIGSI